MSARIVALDVSGEAGAAAGGRVALSLGLVVLLDHPDEGERLRRVGAFVRDVLQRAGAVEEIEGRRRLLWSGRSITTWRTEVEGAPATLLLSRWEDSPGDLVVEVLERRQAGGGWVH